MNIINNLSEGYRLLGRHVHLLLIPALLDIFLWRMPNLAIGELLQKLVDFYIANIEEQSLGEDIQELLLQSSENLSELGNSFNLMDLLVSRSLMHVPSIMLYTKPLLTDQLADPTIRQITNPGDLLGLVFLFGLLSLLIGVLYLRMLVTQFENATTNAVGMDKDSPAQAVDSTDSTLKDFDLVEFVKDSSRQWLRIVAFCFIMVCVLLALYIPISFVIILLMMFVPTLGTVAAMLLSAAAFMLFFYLYFATIGMVLDDLAIFEAVKRSFKLMRQNFFASIGIIVLIYFITQGIGMLLQQAVLYGPVGIIAAILFNAYIGTGAALALFHFYRERINGLDNPELNKVSIIK